MLDLTVEAKDLAEVPSHVPHHLVIPAVSSYSGYTDDPFELMQEVRKQTPEIFYELNRDEAKAYIPAPGFWVVSSAEGAREALQKPDYFTTTVDYPGGIPVRPYKQIPVELDPPDHAKYRALLAPLFSPKSIEALSDLVEGTCGEFIDNMMAKGETASFMDDFARPFPATVFMKMMGLPMERQETFIQWEKEWLGLSQDFQRALQAKEHVAEMLRGVIAERRKAPQNDIVTSLSQAEVDGEPIDEATLLNMCMLLFVAGLDTVTAGIMHVFAFLGTHPTRKQELIDDPSLISGAVEELLRYHSWIASHRYVRKDVVFRGVEMKEGDRLAVIHTYASHDPEAFEQPGEINFNRGANPHFAFAAGIHRCAGSHLARRELRLAVSEWLRRAPDFRVKAGYKIRYPEFGMPYPEELALEWTPEV
ncbi:MAG: cytochrome P450 [Gammaproteobacteria bacterium]|nr:cytochrome P450 [Gammaproteobacteria bacterium]